MSKTLIQGLAQNLFKNTDDQLVELFGEDDAIDEAKVIDFFSNQLKAKVKKVGEDQLGRGRKDAHTLWNKIVKEQASTLGVELTEGLTEAEMIDLLLQGKPGEGKKEELTAEKLRGLPIFKEVFDADVKALKEKLAATEAEKAKQAQEFTAKFNSATTVQAAFDALEAAKWRKGDNEEEIAKRRTTITDLLKLHTSNFQSVKVEDGKVYIVDEKGEVKRDSLHDPIEFSAFVLGLNPFGTHEFDPNKGSSGASGGKKTDSGSDYKVVDGVSLADALNGVTDPAERAKIMRAYSAAMNKK